MGEYTVRRPSGYATWAEPNAPLSRERDTVQCCHCNMHFYVVPGSGTVRGFCSMCSKPTCGKRTCQPCLPFEKALDIAMRRKQFFEALGVWS